MSSPPDDLRLDTTLVACLDKYFEQLGDQPPHSVHAMVIEAIERPLLVYMLQRSQQNLSHAAEALGLSRTTLRKKLKTYQLNLENPCPLPSPPRR